MGIRAKGVQRIKTLASVRGTGAHSNERHVHQFQLASLELERTRRSREKQVAVRQIKVVDARLVEIDELIRSHQEALGLASIEGPSPGQLAARIIKQTEPEKRRVLRY